MSQKCVSEKQLDINQYNSENLNIRSAVEGYRTAAKKANQERTDGRSREEESVPKKKEKVMSQLLTRNVIGTLVIHGICKKSDSLCTLNNFGLLYISYKISRQTGR